MPEPTSQITIISDLLKRDPAYREVIDQLEERLYNRYMIYLADKPRFNTRTQAIPRPYLNQIISFKNTIELNKLAKKYNFTQEQRDIMPGILWKIFYREAEMKNLPQMLNSELGINNIRTAYIAAIDIANIYMPISDYLGDVGMVIKRWQYEMPAEPAIGNQQPAISQQPIQPQKELPIANYQLPTATPPPPIKPLITIEPNSKDESIPKVQETMNRIAQIGIIQKPQDVIPPPISNIQSPTSTSPKSDLEPEYLPDEPAKQPSPIAPETQPANNANVIDLKNF